VVALKKKEQAKVKRKMMDMLNKGIAAFNKDEEDDNTMDKEQAKEVKHEIDGIAKVVGNQGI